MNNKDYIVTKNNKVRPNNATEIIENRFTFNWHLIVFRSGAAQNAL